MGKPKSDASIRDVAVPPHLMDMLKAHIAEYAQPSPGAPIPQHSLQELLQGEEGCRAGRSAPHTGAVLAASTGATLAELMARLGHSTSQAALRYQHAAAGRDAHIAAKLSEIAEAV